MYHSLHVCPLQYDVLPQHWLTVLIFQETVVFFFFLEGVISSEVFWKGTEGKYRLAARGMPACIHNQTTEEVISVQRHMHG